MDPNLIARFYSDHPQANRIWRFFSDANHQWKWEQLAFDGTVLEQSREVYPQYEGCLADAIKSGYVFVASPASTKPQSNAPKTKRSYMRMPSQNRRQASTTAPEAKQPKKGS